MKKHIPSVLTCANLICGFLAILSGDFYVSGWFIFAGMFLDVGDGIAARVLNAQSEIGKELDSMADLVTFGVAPAYLYFLLAPGDGWGYFIPGIIFLLGSALRLAIFNTLESKKTFTGLATPASAFFMFGIFMSYNSDVPIITKMISDDIGYFIIPIFLVVMMLSRLEMFSLKSIKAPIWNNPYHIISILSFLIVLFLNPPLAPCAAVLSYIILALISGRSLLKFTKQKNQK
ncbi:MAG: CDP-alcohol phosphatidyltransferase family protein [Bacteroidota bacterium]